MAGKLGLLEPPLHQLWQKSEELSMAAWITFESECCGILCLTAEEVPASWPSINRENFTMQTCDEVCNEHSDIGLIFSRDHFSQHHYTPHISLPFYTFPHFALFSRIFFSNISFHIFSWFRDLRLAEPRSRANALKALSLMGIEGPGPSQERVQSWVKF